jgi:alpha-tubulin suppressor-like RCC1 family protein
MRVLARLAILGILVISCRDNIIGPEYDAPPEYVCEPTAPDTMFEIYRDSIRMAVGAAEAISMEWATYDGCTYEALPSSALTWTIRDSAVVRDTVPEWATDGRPRYVLPKAPGQTVVAVETVGRADSVVVTVPDTVAIGTVVDVGAGPSVSCAVTDDATVWCWGGGEVLGEWGDPTLGTCMGSECSPMPVARATGAESVHAQTDRACMLDVSGTASCWGRNYSYQLGNRNPVYASTPVEVEGGHSFTSLSLGWEHSCGIGSDGTGYCWGSSVSGRLGGDYRDGATATPINVDSTRAWISIEARQATTCGVTDAGHLHCWGILGTSGDPGPPGAERCEFFTTKDGATGSSPCAYSPLRMPLVAALAADSLFAQVSGHCALTTQGSVYCYDTHDRAYRPMTTFGVFETLTAGASHTCGVRAAGTAACWGSNWSGQLGNGTTIDRSAPVSVSGGQIWDKIAAAGDHTCGLTMGEVWCWGATYSGQAGTTILENQLTPAKAHGQD